MVSIVQISREKKRRKALGAYMPTERPDANNSRFSLQRAPPNAKHLSGHSCPENAPIQPAVAACRASYLLWGPRQVPALSADSLACGRLKTRA